MTRCARLMPSTHFHGICANQLDVKAASRMRLAWRAVERADKTTALARALRTGPGISVPFWTPTHPAWLRCSSLTYARYARSSRLAMRAPRRPEWHTYSRTGPKHPDWTVRPHSILPDAADDGLPIRSMADRPAATTFTAGGHAVIRWRRAGVPGVSVAVARPRWLYRWPVALDRSTLATRSLELS
jgi:hypothetical protein